MANVKLKTHYTAQELADFNLSGLPKTRPGIVDRAKKVVGKLVCVQVVVVVLNMILIVFPQQ